MTHINVYVHDDTWNEVRSRVGYGRLSEFVRDALEEKLERMEEKKNE
jgi:Arc/MetJ-type ribon-helix-helix transcriptional regulator